MDDEFRFDGSVSKCEGSLGNLRLSLIHIFTSLRSHSQSVSQNRVPTTAELGGDFSDNNISTIIYDPATYDPSTGTSQPFQNNQIDLTTREDNFAKQFLKLLPAANHTLGANNVNYITNLASPNNSDQYIARGDWNIAGNNQLNATMLHFSDSNGNDTIVPGLFGIFIATSGTNAALQDSWELSQNKVNVLKIGFNRGNVLRSQQGEGSQNFAANYGLVNIHAAQAQWEMCIRDRR